ncbi:hypothetical protein JCM18909_1678 [Cutibacterium acnes JCM 18909]|nr:hypothetical protein JCM18909_1678 [Cutibacterium acnes JCM 18909]
MGLVQGWLNIVEGSAMPPTRRELTKKNVRGEEAARRNLRRMPLTYTTSRPWHPDSISSHHLARGWCDENCRVPQRPSSVRNLSASRAARHPDPAAVTACW